MVQDAHESKEAGLIACCVIMMSLSGITVACRLAVRRTTRAGLWYDDYVMIAALLFSYGTGLAVLFGKNIVAHVIFCPLISF